MPAAPRHEHIDGNMVDAPFPGSPPGRWPRTRGTRRDQVVGSFIAVALLAVVGIAVRHAAPAGQRGYAAPVGQSGQRSDPAAGHYEAGTGTPDGEVDGARFDPLYVQFVDRDHGFALTATCAGGQQPCSYGLAVSADGGRSYRHRALPLAKIPPIEGYSAELHAVTGRTVVIEDRGSWWVSVDAGRTWRSARDSGAPDIAAIPAAGRLHTRCADANCDVRTLTVIDPDTGRPAVLPHVPLARVLDSSESTVAADGTRWISGTAAGGDPALATTRDGGRTWSVSRFPRPGRLLSGPRLLVGPGKLRYAVFTVQRENAKNGFGPLYASADAGRTWTLVPGGEGRPASLLGAIVRRDGRLLIGTELDGPMISADGGRTFARLDTGPRLAHFAERSEMITATGSDGAHYTSRDGGAQWSPVTVPAVPSGLAQRDQPA